jgi:hypothetical protein
MEPEVADPLQFTGTFADSALPLKIAERDTSGSGHRAPENPSFR